jgi:hypothetical protein
MVVSVEFSSRKIQGHSAWPGGGQVTSTIRQQERRDGTEAHRI